MWYLVAVIIMIAILLGCWYWPSITYKVYLHHSKSLPFLSETFVGREREMETLLNQIDFYNHSTRGINIYGPPGFGKSTLAIHVGHVAVREGVEVHYVNMVDIPDKEVKQGLARKILKKAADFDDLLEWAREYRFWYTQILLIFDNCDEVLHGQREEFLTAVTRVAESSLIVRIILTSRELVTLSDYFAWYKVDEISASASSGLLDLKVSKKVGLTQSQREQIAELTGNVPLALHIVSSLFNIPSAPSPSEVIQGLDKDIIHILSPEDFPAHQKLKNSIGLSVNYLSHELKLSGCQLIVFPGSFDKDAANAVLDNSIALFLVTPVRDILTSLVKTSLLEFNERTSRYQYHRLIKEYFVDLVKYADAKRQKGALGNSISHSAFLVHYAQKLIAASNLLRYDHHTSLSILYTEQHNFQLLLDYLSEPQVLVNKEFILSVIAVSTSINVGLFWHRFSSVDWCGPIENALIQLDKVRANIDWFHMYSIGVAQKTFLSYYVLLISQSAKCREIAEGVKAAAKVYTDRRSIVEMNKWQMVSRDYIAYYNSLADYYSGLDQEDNVRECHRRIIHQANVHRATCEPNQCSNDAIGTMYQKLGEYEKAAEFLEKALKDDLTTLDRLHVLIVLYACYNVLHHSERRQLVVTKLLELQNQLVNEVSNSELYHSDLTLPMITIFRNNDYEKEANTLEERLLDVILKFRAQPQQGSVSMDKVYQFAQHLFDNKYYDKVVDVGMYIVESLNLRNPNEIHLKLRVELLMGKAKFLAGNYSEGMDDIETVLLEIMNHPGQDYTEEKNTSCWYLILRIRYINTCYDIKTKLGAAVMGAAYLVLRSPLDYPADHHSQSPAFTEHESSPSNLKAEHVSSSKEVTTKGTGSLTTVLFSNMEEVLSILFETLQPIVHDQVNLVTRSINHIVVLMDAILSMTVYPLLQSPIFCFLINVSYVWVKLCVFYGLLIFIRHPLRSSMFIVGIVILTVIGQLRLYIRIIRDPRCLAANLKFE